MSSKADFPAEPTCLSTNSPFLKNNTVGMLRIPYSAATSPFSSTSHERGRGEFLDVGEGKLLDMAVLGGAQIGAEALAGNGGAGRAAQAEAQRHHGHDHHLDALPGHIGLIGVCDADVHDIAHDQRDQQFKDRLGSAAQHPQGDPFAVWPRMRPKSFQHRLLSSSRF